MTEEELKDLLAAPWPEKLDEHSFSCPVCGALVQETRIPLHKEYHLNGAIEVKE